MGIFGEKNIICWQHYYPYTQMVWCRWRGTTIKCPYTQYSVRNLNGHGFLAPLSKKIPQVSPNNARLSIEGSLVISDFDQHIHPPMVCIFASGQANTISQWDPQPSKLVSYPRGQESARDGIFSHIFSLVFRLLRNFYISHGNG